MRTKLTLASVAICATSFVCAKDSRPNIIFLLTDDQRDNTLSAMGHDYIKTPALDRIMTNGVRFSNAYIAEPTSCPSRVALFTGVHERVNGVGFESSYQLTEEQWEQSYPNLLRNSGYYTGFMGKFGVEYYTFKDKVKQKFDVWYGHNGWAGFYINTEKGAYAGAKENIITRIMGDGMVEFIENAPRDKPFCLSVSFSTPHGSAAYGMGPFNKGSNQDERVKNDPIYGDLYRDDNIQIPDETATDAYKYIPKALMDQTKGRNRTYSYNYTRPMNLEHHIRYFQMITGIDAAVAEMLTALEKAGLDENTIIIFGSDHGLLMGEYGMGGKALLYDLASKIPCFVYDPRLPDTHRGKDVSELVSSLDITSTILDYAEVKQPKQMQGTSLLPLIEQDKVKWRDYIFMENLYTGRDTPFQEGIRKGEWKYIRMYDGVTSFVESDVNFVGRDPEFEQLFNLNDDPNEKNNLISSAEHKEVLSKLRKLCQTESVKLNKSRDLYNKSYKSVLR